jgi:hypothetical protein
MPSSSAILELITVMANDLTLLAFGWHLVVLLIAIAMLRGWRPSARAAGSLLIAPALSVFVVSASYGSWFNAASFLVLPLALALLTRKLVVPWRVRVSTWSSRLGVALVAFGFVYPHFIEGPWYRSFYAAPMGVVPCPTLAVLAGFALITGASGSRAIPLVLAVWTAFYAVFGILKLDVLLDIGLLGAATGLLLLAIHNARQRARFAQTARWWSPAAHRVRATPHR